MDAWTPITTSAKLSLPLNGTVFTTTRKVPAEKRLPDLGGTMGATLGAVFATSRIIEATELPDGEGRKDQTVIHALIPTEAEQLLSNWEFATCSIGGQKFDGITRTVIYPAAEFSATLPALGSAMPLGADDLFAGAGYILTGRNAARSGMQLEPVFKVEVREYVKRVSMANVGIDSLNGKPLFELTVLLHAGEPVPGSVPPVTAAVLFTPAQTGNAFWGIQANGFENSGSQLSAEWFALTSSQVVAGTATVVDDATVVAVSTAVPSNDAYYWPPVLQYVDFMDWQKREGGEDILPLEVYKHQSYRGPCRTLTTRTWSKGAFVIPVADQMLPNSIHYASPFFSLNIPECLHGVVPCRCDIGNADPTYIRNVGSLRIFLATNHTDWPVSIIGYDDQEPYRGGYLRTRRQIFSPSGAGGGAAVVIVPVPTSFGVQSLAGTSVTLGWTAAAGATGHLLEIATDAAFATFVAYREPVLLEADTLAELTHLTTYWARVSTFIGYHKSAPCPAISFTTPA